MILTSGILDWSKVGVAISTYADDWTSDGRVVISNNCVTSVLKSVGKECVKIIVDDASTHKLHLENLDNHKDDFHIVKNIENVGNMSGKNISIKHMYDAGCEYMFLLDDDIKVFPGWVELYINAIQKTNVHHFQFACSKFVRFQAQQNRVIINGVELTSRTCKQGALMTLTRKCIEKVGYFKIGTCRYGHAHGHYSGRLLRANFSHSASMDVNDSENFVEYHGWANTPGQLGFGAGQASDYKKEIASGEVDRSGKYIYADSRLYIPYEIHSKLK